MSNVDKDRCREGSNPAPRSPGENLQLPKVLVLVPDMPGGISSLFLQLRAQPCANPAPEIVFFTTHDGGRNALLCFPLRLVKFIRALTRDRIDLCHINLSVRGSTLRKLIFGWICRRLGCPYVIHLHGSTYREFFEHLPAPAKTIVQRFFRNAAGVIVLGTVWRDYVVSAIGVEPERITVLPNAVAGPVTFSAAQNDDVPRILFLGRLGERKGVPELIEALASPQMRALSWTATLAGDGDIARFRSQANALALADRVAFPGWVDPEQAAHLLQASHILVLPSHAENLPLSMLEAMAYGLCPIVTPVGAIPDVIKDGGNGILVPVGDAAALASALAGIVGQPEKRRRLAAKARADFQANYDIRDYRKKLEAIYLDVLSD